MISEIQKKNYCAAALVMEPWIIFGPQGIVAAGGKILFSNINIVESVKTKSLGVLNRLGQVQKDAGIPWQFFAKEKAPHRLTISLDLMQYSRTSL